MAYNLVKSLLGAIPTALALNLLHPAAAAAQPAQATKPVFDPTNIPPEAMEAGAYTAFNTAFTERDQQSHFSKPGFSTNRQAKLCPEDGNVCVDLSAYPTLATDWIGYIDAIRAAKEGDTSAVWGKITFPIPEKIEREKVDTSFSEDIYIYLSIFQAADASDGAEDLIVHGSGLAKLLAKPSPERAKLEQKLQISLGETDLMREVYIVSSFPILKGLTEIVYGGRKSMVVGYVPQSKLTQAHQIIGTADEAQLTELHGKLPSKPEEARPAEGHASLLAQLIYETNRAKKAETRDEAARALLDLTILIAPFGALGLTIIMGGIGFALGRKGRSSRVGPRPQLSRVPALEYREERASMPGIVRVYGVKPDSFANALEDYLPMLGNYGNLVEKITGHIMTNCILPDPADPTRPSGMIDPNATVTLAKVHDFAKQCEEKLRKKDVQKMKMILTGEKDPDKVDTAANKPNQVIRVRTILEMMGIRTT